MNPLSRKTRREFIAAGLKSSAASFLTFPPTLARGQPLGTVPFVSEGETSPGSLHGSGLGGRLVLDLSTLTEDSLTTSNGNFFIRTAFPDQLHEISPWETAALTAALDFMGRTHQQDKPFFVWCNSTRMHIWTHLKAASEGVTGQGIYADGMVEHDGYVGQLLDKLDELGITDDTIVMYATDNGAELMSWPDGGMIPFRGEKNTTWEGGFRLPMMVRWPGKIKGGSISNEIIAMMDWMPTLVAAAGDPDIKEKLLNGHTAGGKTFKVHLDGYNFLPYMTGQASKGPRDEFFYFTDDGSLSALRYRDWKMMFSIQEAHGFEVWVRPFTVLRVPRLFNLRRDPFERADRDSDFYTKFFIDHMFVMVPAQALVAKFLQTFQKFPPRQKPASFTIDQVIEKLAPPSN